MASSKRRRDVQLARAQTAATLTGHGHVAAALKLAGAAAGRFRDRRIEQMWEAAVHGVDEPLEFTRRVEQALLRDGDDVAFGFVTAAQAAADAVAPVAVASIGLLARSFLVQGKPDRRTYRGLLAALRSVDDVEYGALRDVMHRAATIDRDLVDSTVHWQDLGDGDGQWEWISDDPEWASNFEQHALLLLEGPLVRPLIKCLGDVLESVPSESRAYSTRYFIPRAVIDALTAVMPPPE